MVRAKDILNADEYSNYRNIRAVSWLFVILGSVLVLGGVMGAVTEDPNPQEQLPVAFAVVIAVVGLAGAVGGVAALCGNRKLAPAAYIMATLYVFAFPVGTILSIVMFRGLSGYLNSRQRLVNETPPG